MNSEVFGRMRDALRRKGPEVARMHLGQYTCSLDGIVYRMREFGFTPSVIAEILEVPEYDVAASLDEVGSPQPKYNIQHDGKRDLNPRYAPRRGPVPLPGASIRKVLEAQGLLRRMHSDDITDEMRQAVEVLHRLANR